MATEQAAAGGPAFIAEGSLGTLQLFFACAVSRMSLLSFPAKSLDQNLSDFVLIFLEIMKHVQSIHHNPISFVDIPEPEERKTFKIKKNEKAPRKLCFKSCPL